MRHLSVLAGVAFLAPDALSWRVEALLGSRHPGAAQLGLGPISPEPESLAFVEDTWGAEYFSVPVNTLPDGTIEIVFAYAGDESGGEGNVGTGGGSPDYNTDGCIKADVTLSGFDDAKVVENVADMEACITECRGYAPCVAMTYNTDTKRCFLKDRFDYVKTETKEGDVTAARECRGDCFLQNTKFIGDLVDNDVRPMYSAHICQAKCVSRKETCGVWSWEAATGQCEMRAVGAQQNGAEYGGNGWISGVNQFCS